MIRDSASVQRATCSGLSSEYQMRLTEFSLVFAFHSCLGRWLSRCRCLNIITSGGKIAVKPLRPYNTAVELPSTTPGIAPWVLPTSRNLKSVDGSQILEACLLVRCQPPKSETDVATPLGEPPSNTRDARFKHESRTRRWRCLPKV